MRKVEFLYMFFCRLMAAILPAKKCVLFCSFYGKYSDNPRYISNELSLSHPDMKQIWVVSDIHENQVPDIFGKVLFGSFHYYWLLFLSQVVVDNSSGLRTFISSTPGTLQYKFCNWLAKKRRVQYNISTWHGTPLKKIGVDALDYDDNKAFISNADYSIAGCEHTYTLIKSAFRNSFKVFKTGTPRNDILCNNNVDSISIKKKLCLPLDKKIILFAPTFRKDSDLGGLEQLNTINYELLLKNLNKRFGGDWRFVFRVHSCVQSVIEKQNIRDKFKQYGLVDGNLGDDMAEYLYCADILLTDYSSSMFDYLLTERPCFLYTPDLFEYMNSERGVYMGVDTLPFPYVKKLDDLYEVILNFDYEGYLDKVRKYQKEIGNFEDGNASKRISDDIITYFKTKTKFTLNTVDCKL